MSRPFQLGQQSKGKKFRKWFKRQCSKLLRQQAKINKNPEQDVNPKRRFLGWD